MERSPWNGATGGARAVAPGFFPLDKALGLLPGPWTPHAREAIVRMGTVLPFEQVPAVLATLCRLPVSVSTVRAITEAAGATLCAVTEAECARVQRDLPDAPRGPETAQVSVDGAMVPIVGGVWREVRTLVIGRVRRGAGGAPTTDHLSYFSRMTDAAQFGEMVTGEIHRRGVERSGVVAAVADGAPWCQQLFDLHVPQAVRILDFPHAIQHLGGAAHAVFGEQSAEAVAWLTHHRHALRDGDPETVLTALRDLPVERSTHPDDARRVRDRAWNYFATRRAQIRYAEFSARGLPIGSGAVESANKLVVEARLKRAGMHWAPRHVDPILALHSAHCSQQWQESWAAICAYQRRRVLPAHPSACAPTPSPPPRADALLPTTPPRPKTIVNGRPTALHPWKRSRAC